MFPSGPVHRHRTAHLHWVSVGLFRRSSPLAARVMEFPIARTIQSAAVNEQLFCGLEIDFSATGRSQTAHSVPILLSVA
jgi:hypothetical protein